MSAPVRRGPCRTCGALVGEPCRRSDGSQMATWHANRPAAKPAPRFPVLALVALVLVALGVPPFALGVGVVAVWAVLWFGWVTR